MYFKTEMTIRPTALLLFCFSQLAVINQGESYLFITQPPSNLQCNPYSSNPSLKLECSIVLLGRTQLPADTCILWYRRAPDSMEEQLCGSTVATFMVSKSSLLSDKSVGLRSIIELRASSRDLLGKYWCQVAKTDMEGYTLLSNRSSVLEIVGCRYYQELSKCEAGTVFFDITSPLPTVDFSSSSPIIAEDNPCLMDSTPPITMESNATNANTDAEVDDSFILSRMWVYILAPVIATLLIFLFLILLTALVATCFQKRDPKKRLAPTIANIEFDASTNSIAQIKSSALSGKSTAVFNAHARSATQTPTTTPRTSINVGSALHVDLGKQLQPFQQQQNLQSGAEDKDNENEEDYTEVPSKHNRKAAKVIGKLRGTCNVEIGPQSTETGSNGTVDVRNFEYRSLDLDAMEPPHTYHTMQSATNADGPQPMYSEPGIHHGHQKVILTKKQRPTPPLKIPPRRGGNRSKSAHKPVQSVPSGDGEYVDPNDCNSPTSPNMYQGLTPNKLDYLALYTTPDSTPH